MSTDKIFVAGASWCGFTTKAFDAIDNSNDSEKFEKLNCDKEHADHAMCKNVEAYPTFKKDDNTNPRHLTTLCLPSFLNIVFDPAYENAPGGDYTECDKRNNVVKLELQCDESDVDVKVVGCLLTGDLRTCDIVVRSVGGKDNPLVFEKHWVAIMTEKPVLVDGSLNTFVNAASADNTIQPVSASAEGGDVNLGVFGFWLTYTTPLPVGASTKITIQYDAVKHPGDIYFAQDMGYDGNNSGDLPECTKENNFVLLA